MEVIKLEVPYFTQMDNYTGLHRSPSRQCNLTSHAMALEYITKGHLSERVKANKGMVEPEDWYGHHLAKYGDTTDNRAHTKCISEVLKLKNFFKQDGGIDDLIFHLQRGRPIPIGVHYKASGHWVCVCGVDVDRDMFFVHDPYGIRAGSEDRYLKIGYDYGSFDYYSFDLMLKIWCGSNENDGWMRDWAFTDEEVEKKVWR